MYDYDSNASNGWCQLRVSLRRKVMGVMVAFLSCNILPSAVLAAEPAPDKEYFDIVKNIDLLGEVYREVSRNYVDPVNASELMYAGIDGMLRTLDPYTVFLDEEDAGELDEHTTGQYVGVGITIASIEGIFYVSSVTDGHAAAKAGIRIGDRIMAINNKETSKTSPDEVRGLIKGTSGSSVIMLLERKGAPSFTVTLLREDVRVNTVSHSGMIGDIGYLEMKSFGTRSALELREAFQQLLRQAREGNVSLKGIILDLRGNPGGLLNAAVDVSSVFVREGTDVVSIQGRSKEMSKSYRTEAQPLDVTIPLVVLINGQSASASEIVSGLVQDIDRGVVIGERSFGKGLVQSVIRISYDCSLKLTIAKYYTPSGRLIQKEVKAMSSARKVVPKVPGGNAAQPFYTKGGRKVYGGGGITPDIEVSEPVSSPYLAELRRKGIFFLFANDYCFSNPVKPTAPLDRAALMLSFNDFLRNKKFIYTSDAERRFGDLKASMKKTQQEGGDIRNFEALQQEVNAVTAREIERESSAVAQALEVEILRHYSMILAREAELNHDIVVKKAVELLSDSAKYSAILHPPVPVN